ncbi:MAG: sugar ABC transporter substrate-binding protein [Spartobacteria bacterium]|nr:sugar ABC transporter substrate-binding protein [Spartobacteria bacterium]
MQEKRMKRERCCEIRSFAYLLVLSILCLEGAGCGNSPPETTQMETDKPVSIGLSLGAIRIDRWRKDEQLIRQYAREHGAVVTSYAANENQILQGEQAEKLIIQGVDVLIVVAHDTEMSASIVKMAHDAGIQVIAYDRLILNCDLDYYVSFDSKKVGEYQAEGVLQAMATGDVAYIGGSPVDHNAHLLREGTMSVLAPYLADGSVRLVLDTFIEQWSGPIAYQHMKDYLDEHGHIDGVIAANDSTAAGVIQALKEFGLAGKAPVSGQDAELAACRRIVEGAQTVTVYKPFAMQARKAVEMALDIAAGIEPSTNATMDNGQKAVPSFLLPAIPVTRENINETIVADGFYSQEELYTESQPRQPDEKK